MDDVTTCLSGQEHYLEPQACAKKLKVTCECKKSLLTEIFEETQNLKNLIDN